MGINILDADIIAFSHGHLNHTWGMEHLMKHSMLSKGRNGSNKSQKIIAHPQTFDAAFKGLAAKGSWS